MSRYNGEFRRCDSKSASHSVSESAPESSTPVCPPPSSSGAGSDSIARFEIARFERLIAHAARRALRATRDRAIGVDDLAQEGRIAALGCGQDSSALAYRKIYFAMLESLRRKRKRRHMVPLSEALAELTAAPRDIDMAVDAHRLLRASPPRTQAIAVLVATGHTLEETGDALGVSKQAVRVTLKRAWEALEAGRAIGVAHRPRAAA